MNISRSTLDRNWKISDSKILKMLDNPNDHRLRVQNFPVQLFPTEISQFIVCKHQYLNTNMEFTGSAILSVLFSLLGKMNVTAVNQWEEPCIGWFGLVGGSGSGKTPAINSAIQPIQSIDLSNYNKWKEDATPNQNVEQIIATDITYESLVERLLNNQAMLGVYDELLSFKSDMNRYKSGDTESKFLSMWNGAPLSINRKSSQEYTLVPEPRYNVIGGLQPSLLKIAFPQKSQSNGMMSRMLFAIDSEGPQKMSKSEIPLKVSTDYYDLIKRIHVATSAEGFKKRRNLCFDTEAKEFFREWSDSITLKILQNSKSSENLKRGTIKMRSYFIRFAGLFEVLNSISNYESIAEIVSINSVRKAGELCDFYLVNLIQILDLVNEPLADTMTIEHQILKQYFDYFRDGINKMKATKLVYENGYTYSQISKATGFSKGTISNYLNHK